MATNKINAQIRLRADTISNWLLNPSSVINDRELIVVKYDSGSIGFKFGTGKTYPNTPFIKFESLCIGSLTNGTNTYDLPAKDGTLSLTSDLDLKANQTDLDTLNAIIATLITENQTQNSIIATLVTELNTIQTNLTAVTNRVTSLENSFSNLEQRLSQLEQ